MPGIEIKGRSKIANYRHGGRTGKFGGGRTNLLEQLGRVEAEPSNPNRRAEISRVHGELNRGYKTGGRIGLRKGKGVIPKRSQRRHKETTIPSRLRLDSQRKNIRLKAEHASGSMKEKKHTPYITEEGKKMVPSFNTSGQFLGYNEKKRTTTKKRNLEPELVPHRDKDKPTPVRSSRMQSLKEERLEEFEPKRPADGPVRTQAKRSPTHPDDLRPEQAEDGTGFAKGGKADKRWIQKAVNPKHKGYCTPMTKKTCTPARKALARTFKKKAKTGW